MITLILFAALSGLVAVLSPCILPVLPIVLSSSAVSGKTRPLGVITGLMNLSPGMPIKTSIGRQNILSMQRGPCAVLILAKAVMMNPKNYSAASERGWKVRLAGKPLCFTNPIN